MRGTQTHGLFANDQCGIIPAYAGNTREYYHVTPQDWDHPRVCGEHNLRKHLMRHPTGSSPRMRGTPVSYHSDSGRYGIIPAYAGNTADRQGHCLHTGDHPRVCGEHQVLSAPEVRRLGSSPRMRGTLGDGLRVDDKIGIIPAYAGNTHHCHRQHCGQRDHPRVCGEHAAMTLDVYADLGSSPRMRGTLGDGLRVDDKIGIIPAYAGNTHHCHRQHCGQRDHPRVCGEHAAMTLDVYADLGSSPRMRGTLSLPSRRIYGGGIIPAYAGNTAP